MIRIANYVNGAFTASIGGTYLDNHNPATGEVYSLIPDSDGRDVEAAVEAAKSAFPAWSALSRAERSLISAAKRGWCSGKPTLGS